MRAFLHYSFSLIILTVYGGEVCPLVETLDVDAWFLELLLVFSVVFLLRFFILNRLVLKRPYEEQVFRQFVVELGLFLFAGAVLTVINDRLYGFPHIESGMKIVLGCLILGFFEAVDLVLERERMITRDLAQNGRHLNVSGPYFPVAHKFALVATVTSLSAAGVVLLLVLKDLGWMTGSEALVDVKQAQRAILIEISFSIAVFLGEVLNMVFSFARNLRLMVDKENRVLESATQGDLNQYVVISTRDEFGVMGRYTNNMIDSLRQRTDELQLTQDSTIVALASLAETRDNETGSHILRTQRYVHTLALHLRDNFRFKPALNNETIDLLFKSAPLHDVGKVGVPDAILLKPGRLTPEEFEIMKKHPIYGRDSLQTALDRLGENSFLSLAQEIAYTHHEKWDGSGYPLGLKGDDIPVSGRLMALADVYDALISKRIYKPAFSHEKAKAIILEGRGTHFDPDVVDAFLAVEGDFRQIAREYADNAMESGKEDG